MDDVEDMANGAEGLFGGAGRAANLSAAFAAGVDGVAFADDGAGGWAGFVGVVCGVTFRGIGRGFGSGTADAACETSAIAIAPKTAAVQRLDRDDPADEANGVTGALCGESFRSLRPSVVVCKSVLSMPHALSADLRTKTTLESYCS